MWDSSHINTAPVFKVEKGNWDTGTKEIANGPLNEVSHHDKWRRERKPKRKFGQWSDVIMKTLLWACRKKYVSACSLSMTTVYRHQREPRKCRQIHTTRKSTLIQWIYSSTESFQSWSTVAHIAWQRSSIQGTSKHRVKTKVWENIGHRLRDCSSFSISSTRPDSKNTLKDWVMATIFLRFLNLPDFFELSGL